MEKRSPNGVYGVSDLSKMVQFSCLSTSLSRLGTDSPLAVAEGSERREEEAGVEDGEAGARNANHPTTVSEVNSTDFGV